MEGRDRERGGGGGEKWGELVAKYLYEQSLVYVYAMISKLHVS